MLGICRCRMQLLLLQTQSNSATLHRMYVGICHFSRGNRKHLVVLFNIFTLLYSCVYMGHNISERKGIFSSFLLESRSQREFGGVHLPTGSQGQRGSAPGCNRSRKRGTERGATKKLFLSHGANESRPEMLQPVPAERIPSVESINNRGSPGYSRALTAHRHVLRPAHCGGQALGN